MASPTSPAPWPSTPSFASWPSAPGRGPSRCILCGHSLRGCKDPLHQLPVRWLSGQPGLGAAEASGPWGGWCASALRCLLTEMMGWGLGVLTAFQPASYPGDPAFHVPATATGGWAGDWSVLYRSRLVGGPGSRKWVFPGDRLHMCTNVRHVSSCGLGAVPGSAWGAQLGPHLAAGGRTMGCVCRTKRAFSLSARRVGASRQLDASCLEWSITLPLPGVKPSLLPSLPPGNRGAD